VDGRDKPGHDFEMGAAHLVIASLAFFTTSFGVA
jgi:hypothetical protein